MPGFNPVRLVWWVLGVVLLGAPVVSRAQRAAVSGQLTAPAGATVEMATVTLLRAADSVVVKTEFSDAAGRFQLEAGVGQRYLVSVRQVGYRRYVSPAFVLLPAGQALGQVQLVASATALQEITVTGRKPLFEHQADRTIVNVADSPLSAGATTLDVLGRSPGITTDGSNNLALRGRQGLLVVIDGKRVPLTGAELADYLRALPAEQVQRLELITNPPASYDAQGGAGVIAIVLKKDQRLGTNGSANASYGRGVYGKFIGGLALNYRRKNLNIYGNYAYTDRRGFFRQSFDRQYLTSPQQSVANSLVASERPTWLRSHAGKAGFDLTLSKRTQLGASVSVLASQTLLSTNSDIQFFDLSHQLVKHFTSVTDQDINRPNGSVNLNLRHAFADSAGASSLAFDADYARYNVARLTGLTTYFDAPTAPTALLTGDQRSVLDIGAVKADYSQPLSHRARLDAGVKVTRIASDNNVVFDDILNGAPKLDPAISSQFQYHENVNAAYASVSGAQAGTTLQAGLRAEQTNTLAETVGGSSRERHYIQLFPSLLVQRPLSKLHALALAVARRVDRPSYGQLNPLRAYIDATSYISGNPDLVASTSYNFELTHTYKQKFSTSLAYSRTDQPIITAIQPSPDGGQIVVSRDVNITTRQLYTLTLTAPLELAKWWTLYANGVLYYDRYVGNLENTPLDRGQLAGSLTLNNSFSLPHGWSADVNGLYESRQVGGFQLLLARGQVAAGIQKSVWNKQGTLRLNVADIFYTTPLRAISSYVNFNEYFRSRTDARVATIAFTYRFGNTKVAAARKRAAGADEELRRAGGQ